mmetsp:Transcript_884/g.2077  ORF Transcript_884/g.2077 Transcript_884/m.2077 type:complete len:322 (+) Transcript_884:2507-3472(+)
MVDTSPVGCEETDGVILVQLVVLWIHFKAKNLGKMLGSRQLLPSTSHHSICNNEDDLVLLRIRRSQHRINSLDQLLPSLVVTRNHHNHLILRILLRVRPRCLGNVHERAKHLCNHDQCHKSQEEVHENVEHEAHHVETSINDSHVKELVHAHQDTIVGIHREEEFGGIFVQLVDHEVVQGRFQVSHWMVLLNLLRLIITNVVHVVCHVVHTIMNRHPESKGRLQQHPSIVSQNSLLKFTHVLGSLIDTRHEGMTGHSILLILVRHLRTDLVSRLQLLTLLNLGLIQAHGRKQRGRQARKHATGIVVQKGFNSRRSSWVLVE